MRMVGILVALCLLAGVVFFLWSRDPVAPARPVDGGAATRGERGGEIVRAPEAPRPAARPAAGGRSADEIEQSRRRRTELERQIRAAQERQRLAQRPPSGSAGSASVNPPEAEASIDKDYIRAQMREMLPLIRECYQLALDQQPNLSGRLVVRFDILGEKELGGLVEKVQIVREAATDGGAPVIASGQLDECVQATVETLTFKPPKGGGRVTVNYPFLFATEEPETPAPAR